MILYGVIFLFLLIIIYLFISQKKVKEENSDLKEKKLEEIKTYFRKEWEEEERELTQQRNQKINAIESECKTHEFVVRGQKQKLDFEIKNLEIQLVEKEKRYNEVNQDLDLYRKGKIEEIDAGLLELTHKKEILLENEFKEKKENKLKEFDEVINFLQVQEETIKNEVNELKAELDDYRLRRAAINEEIRRERETQLEKDAHRIILSQEDKNDIIYLTTIISNLRHKEILYKLIWSEYLIKPFQNMIKQSFGNNVPKNVIYCIESLDGKYKYIGKTTSEVSKRWTEHIKTSLNIGGVSRSKLHDALYLHWDEFTFTVLEQTEKDKLSEREKYYINFFESDKYGLNIKSGG